MHIREATQSYETYLGLAAELVPETLARKHELMRDNAFSFLRATFYRWLTRFDKVCASAAKAPVLLCAGDLHAENFGTWRDAEGRLIWGINDFDEANLYPYTIDLVRLAASLILAIDAQALPLVPKAAITALLAAYRKQLDDTAPQPFVLEESHEHLRSMALIAGRNPQLFWKKLTAAKTVEVPKKLKKLAAAHLPHGVSHVRMVSRVAGAGSLGLPRYVAIGMLDGGLIAREMKARPPAALAWAGLGEDRPKDYAALIDDAVRAPDPCLWPRKGWLIRRIGPHCERIELTQLDKKKPLLRLVEAMGAETANIHRANGKRCAKIQSDLAERGGGWLHEAASRMAEDVMKDWRAWRKAR